MKRPEERGPVSAGGRYGMAVVRGRSMEPTLSDGDRLLVSYAAMPVVGHLVVARFVDGTVAVKRAAEPRSTRSDGPGWWLLSDNPEEGVDSRHRGPVPSADVLGVVRLRLWPSPRLFRNGMGPHRRGDGPVEGSKT